MSRFGGNRGFGRGMKNVRTNETYKDTLFCESRECGKIIGKGGSKIRELQDSTQTRIKVWRDDEPDGTRRVEINGTEAAVEKARQLIEDVLGFNNSYHNDDGWSDRRAQGDADRYEENADNDRYGQDQQQGNYDNSDVIVRVREKPWGAEDEEWSDDEPQTYLVSKACSNNHDNEQQFDDDDWLDKRPRNSSDRYGNAGDSRYGRNYQQGNSGYRGGRNDGSSSWSKRGSDRYQKRDDDRYGRNQQHGNSGNSANNEKETDLGPREVIYVAGEQVGRLIGKKGANIQELQETSDCTIKVGREENEDGEVTVTLIGFKESICKAKRLISKLGIYFTKDEPDEPEPENSVFVQNGEIDWNLLKTSTEEAIKNKFEALPAIVKEFYKEEIHIRDMHPEEVKQFRLENNNIMVNNPDCPKMKIPNPVPTFKDCFRHYPAILQQIKKEGFTTPSPIQAQAWPILMSGQDLIGIAQTGTGKTLAFLLPALIHIDGQTTPRAKRSGPSMLVLCPTRELALQIEEEVNKFSYKGIRSVCVYGGGSRRDQIRAVRSGVEIIVATPGRLNDLIDNEIINLSSVTYLVLDEADRMLDMGFEPDILKALLDVRPDRQTVMTSATWPLEVQSLASHYMTKPIHVQVGTMDLAAVHSVRQEVVFMDDDDKKPYLFNYLENLPPDEKVIVFAGRKAVVDDLSSDLCMREVDCQSIHGDREQDDRIQALDEFKRGEVRILIATDVASRGLDVKDITHVLNYDFPRNIEEYVHRIGRTGRAGRTGVSITILTRGDWRSAQKLIDIMAEAEQEIPQELLDMAERYKARQERDQREGRGGGRGRGGRGRFGGRRDRDNDFWF